MLYFNKREKNIILSIVNQEFDQILPFCKILEDSFFNSYHGAALLISTANKYILYIKNYEDNNIKSNIIGECFELLNLLKLLRDNNLIFVVPPPALPKVTLIYENHSPNRVHNKLILNDQGEYIKVDNTDYIWDKDGKPLYKGYDFSGEAFEQIQYLFLGFLYPSMNLIELVKRDWVSEEKKQFDEQLKIAELHHNDTMLSTKKQLLRTTYSLWVSNITLLLSIITLGLSIFKQETQISTEQFDRLLETIKTQQDTAKNINQSQQDVDINCPFFSVDKKNKIPPDQMIKEKPIPSLGKKE